MTENFNILVDKLNSFKLKYYLYQILRGLLIVLFLLIVLYVVFSLIEYIVYLPSVYRKILFFGYLIFGILLFIQFVVVPSLKLLHILKPIDTKSASIIIQRNFPDIKDKLLNIIELNNIHNPQYSNEILLASIDQKINELKFFDFRDAVQFRRIRYVLLYFCISIVCSTVIFISNKSIFTGPAKRILYYNTEFVKPAPYTFNLANTNLKAKKGDPFIISVNCEGGEIPQLVYINIEGNNYLMKNSGIGNFEFEMASVINPVSFYFTDLKYSSKKYRLQLLPKPGITNFNVKVTPPPYTALQNKVLYNIGDLQIPRGTKVEWDFTGIDVDSLYLVLTDSSTIAGNKDGSIFNVRSKFYNKTGYNVFIKNNITQPELALSYDIDVVPDLFPEIDIVQIRDSFQLTQFFFKGLIGDDYGFTNLEFHYNVDNIDSSIAIPFVKSLADQYFYYSFDFNLLKHNTGTISYYFSVTDNDVISNYKTTTSNNYTFHFPNKEEIDKTETEQFQNIEDMLERSMEMAGEIQGDMENLRLKNMDSNVSEWEKSKMVSDIISKHGRLEQMYDQIKQNNENLNNYLNSFNKQNSEILEKQKQIEDLLKEVFNDELKKLMDEFNKLADEFNSKELNNLSQKIDLTFEDLQKQMDRNLEMLRKMKTEEKLQKVIDGINKMADEEQEFANQLLEEKNYEKIIKELISHQEGLDELQNDLKNALDLNNELNKPLNFDDFSEEFNDIRNSLEENKSELNNQKKNKSEKGLQNSSEKLKNLAFNMQQMLDKNTMQQNKEDIENLKQILSNLITLSFKQEDIYEGFKNISTNDPQLSILNHEQKKVSDQSMVVKDSLYSLAMRTPSINNMVSNELLTIGLNLDKAAGEIEEGLFSKANVSQLYVITSFNNLALMLAESLEQLENQMADGMSGEQQCENQRCKGKPGMNLLKNESENLKQQLQQMIEQMKSGKQGEMSQQIGKTLMQHEMMQQMLRELMNNGGVGSGAQKQLKEIDELLEQNRRELMNKNISTKTMARQNLITTRLLEAEKAEIERDYDEKRDSKTAKDFYSNPIKFFEYKDNENFTLEYLNKNSHKLNNFYNNIYKHYLNNIEK